MYGKYRVHILASACYKDWHMCACVRVCCVCVVCCVVYVCVRVRVCVCVNAIEQDKSHQWVVALNFSCKIW